jgi:hypothetical protein
MYDCYEKFLNILSYAITKNNLELVSSVCTSEDDTANVETCQNNDKFKVISRTCVVIDCIVIIYNAKGYNVVQINIKMYINPLIPILKKTMCTSGRTSQGKQ